MSQANVRFANPTGAKVLIHFFRMSESNCSPHYLIGVPGPNRRRFKGLLHVWSCPAGVAQSISRPSRSSDKEVHLRRSFVAENCIVGIVPKRCSSNKSRGLNFYSSAQIYLLLLFTICCNDQSLLWSLPDLVYLPLSSGLDMPSLQHTNSNFVS